MRVLLMAFVVAAVGGCTSLIGCDVHPEHTYAYDKCVKDGNPLYWLWLNHPERRYNWPEQPAAPETDADDVDEPAPEPMAETMDDGVDDPAELPADGDILSPEPS